MPLLGNYSSVDGYRAAAIAKVRSTSGRRLSSGTEVSPGVVIPLAFEDLVMLVGEVVAQLAETNNLAPAGTTSGSRRIRDVTANPIDLDQGGVIAAFLGARSAILSERTSVDVALTNIIAATSIDAIDTALSVYLGL